MKKRINLALAAFLLGGIATTLPILGKIIVFTGIALLLFVSYDEFSYIHDHKQTAGGAE
ncbi:hypothetical protein [Enterococcus sp. AZ196]|uniref:hypothetical protein n=1 Tax=Enterococcus sp. AZ196 TaxID=2774659 RepID=UPI003D2D5B8D